MSLFGDVVGVLEKSGVRHALIGVLSLPVARPAGLILLKLHAGGPKDAWDIRSLLDAVDDAEQVTSEVERALPRLPSEARQLWSRLRSEG